MSTDQLTDTHAIILAGSMNYPVYSNWIPRPQMNMLSARIPPLHARSAKSRSVPSQFTQHSTTIQDRLQGRGDRNIRKLSSEEAVGTAVEAVLAGRCTVRRASDLYNIPRYIHINSKSHSPNYPQIISNELSTLG